MIKPTIAAFAKLIDPSGSSGETIAFTPSRIKTEVLSGLTVSLALVPEAVAFAFVAGVEPLVGLYAAFIVGLITAIFGGRPGMISGATGALAVVMVSLVANPPVEGPGMGVQYLFATVVLMGVMQLLAGIFRLGKFIRLVPHPVMLGFVNGLAIVIFMAQMSQFQVDGEWLSGEPMLIMLGLVGLTMGIIWFIPKITKAIPAPLAGIGIVAVLVIALGIDVRNVGDMAQIKGGLPPFAVPDVPFTFETLRFIFPYALILSSIGLIESLLTLNVVGAITEQRGGTSKECIAQGMANTVTGFFGGMGGCAMIGQSMINVKSGGRTRLAGISAALFLLAFILFASGLIEQIPLAALVGVMFMVVIGTFAWQSLTIMRRIPIADAMVIVLVTVVTVLTDLAIAVVVGVIVSALVYAWNNARRIHAESHINEEGAKVYEIEGPLFFGSSEGFAELFDPKNDPEVVIVDFMKSRVVDQSALQAIETLAAKYEALEKTVQLRHLSRICHKLLNRAGQLMIDSEDDPDYGLAVHYEVKTGSFGAGH